MNTSPSFQQQFAYRAVSIVKNLSEVLGLAVGGSWIDRQVDEFSDLDLVLVTKEKVSANKNAMLSYANRLGNLLTGFTGEHVGEPRLLICLYNNPLLHVDIKFLTLEEFEVRVENPFVLYEVDGVLSKTINRTKAVWPYPDFQWIEDRFWVWVHYAALKLGRGEYFEAHDFLGFLRMVVLSPLLQVKNGLKPRGVRKVETELPEADFLKLRATALGYEPPLLVESLKNAISIYCEVRPILFPATVVLQSETEKASLVYLEGVVEKIRA